MRICTLVFVALVWALGAFADEIPGSQFSHGAWQGAGFASATSGVYLMQHFFVDVYIGSILGVLASLITHKSLEFFNKQTQGIDRLNGSLVNMKWK